MQTRINNQQHFGAIKITPFAREAISKRSKNLSKINEIVESQMSNRVNIFVDRYVKSTQLYAIVTFPNHKQKFYKEYIFYPFSDPVSFIKRVCKKAKIKKVEKSSSENFIQVIKEKCQQILKKEKSDM